MCRFVGSKTKSFYVRLHCRPSTGKRIFNQVSVSHAQRWRRANKSTKIKALLRSSIPTGILETFSRIFFTGVNDNLHTRCNHDTNLRTTRNNHRYCQHACSNNKVNPTLTSASQSYLGGRRSGTCQNVWRTYIRYSTIVSTFRHT